MAPKKTLLLEGLLVLAVGVAVLLAARSRAVVRLCESDEIVYALVGRSIADGHGPLSTAMHPRAVVARGVDLRDQHLPGHAYTIAASFALFGPTEAAALLPSQVAFVASGFLLYMIGRLRFGSLAGALSAMSLYIFPAASSLANSAMSEATLLLAGVAHLGVWCSALAGPREWHAAALALLLGLGATHRETFLAYLPATLWVLWRGEPAARRKRLAVFVVTFAAYGFLVLWPALRARAPYPNYVSDALDRALEPSALIAWLGAQVAGNLSALRVAPSTPAGHVWLMTLAAVAAAAALSWHATPKEGRALAAHAALSFAITLVVLFPVYPFGLWAAARIFVPLIGPALLVLGAAAAQPGRRRLRLAVGAMAAVLTLAVTVEVDHALMTRRDNLDRFAQEFSAYLTARIPAPGAGLVIVDNGFRYAWDAYPARVVAWEALDPRLVGPVVERYPIAAALVREEDKRWFKEAVLRAGGHRFVAAADPTYHGMTVLVPE
jgi:4-amino-4-deoxy-L-arabinose transferase-like glycosyltransferase